MKASKKDTQPPLLDLVEVCADGTSLGKTTLANRICHLYRETGLLSRHERHRSRKDI